MKLTGSGAATWSTIGVDELGVATVVWWGDGLVPQPERERLAPPPNKSPAGPAAPPGGNVAPGVVYVGISPGGHMAGHGGIPGLRHT
jgi:hypothetical protein